MIHEIRVIALRCTLILFLLIGATLATAISANDGQTAARPNIVFIMIDDLGWRDVACYGNQVVETPNIDRLSKEGVRFTDFYAAGSVCSPTRCAVQSGQNQARLGLTDFIPGHWRPFEKVITPRPIRALPEEIVTVAESLRSAGYSTGYVGKWHLGNEKRFQPGQQGYDFSAVIQGAHLPGRFRVQGSSKRQPRQDQFRTEFEGDLSIEFIKQNRDHPFFLMLSPYTVHIPLAAESGAVEKYTRKLKTLGLELPHPVYAAMIEQCDQMIGRILDAIEQSGIEKNTLVVFTSDNGGLHKRYDFVEGIDDIVAVQDPLRGEKGSLYEGGIRVPLIVKLPGLVPAGTVCRTPAISYDFFPTFVDLAKGKLPVNQTIDGKSLVPLIREPDTESSSRSLFWHYPHYHHGRPASCIREGEWKLIQYLDGSRQIELFNLAADLSEKNNLVNEKKGRAADLLRKLSDWQQKTAARMPIPNPSYDESRATEWWSTRSGKPVPSSKRKPFPRTEKG